MPLEYLVAGKRVRLGIDDRSLEATLRVLYPPYEVPARSAPGHADLQVRTENGTWIVQEGPFSHRCLTTIEVAEVVEFALTRAFQRCISAAAQVHAAGVIVGPGAVLLVGPEGAGKTSLAFHLSRAGRAVLTDDVTVILSSGRAQGLKRLFKVDPEVLQEAGVPLESTCLWHAGATAAWYDPTVAGGWAEEALVRAVALLDRQPGARPEVRPLGRADALNYLFHSRFATGVRGPDALEALASATQAALPLRLTFGSASAGADTLQQALA
ncbi:MAG TPA: hypothetical protein VD793_11080 [Gemmatimonadales bacterium]|nr:hypothetical protein [Gemmatimonadales bacterium]